MTRCWQLVAAAVLGGLLLPLTAAGGDSKSQASKGKAPRRDDKHEVTQARQKLSAAQKQFAAAAGQAQAAKAKLDQLLHHVPVTRQSVFETYDSTPELQSARQALERSRRQLAEAKNPVLAKLRAQPDYQLALATRDALQLKIKRLPAYAPAEERDPLWHELGLAISRLRQIEREAVAADPEAKTLLDAVAQDEAHVQELCQQRDAAVESDLSLRALVEAIQQTKVEAAVAGQRAAGEARQLAAAKQAYDREVAEERREDEKHKKKSPSKKHPKKRH